MKIVLSALIMMSVLFSIFGCSGQRKQNQPQEIFPKEEFAVLQANMTDGRVVVGSINMAYKDYGNKVKYPWCLKLAIGLNINSVDKNGLPIGGESKIAYELEDELVNEIKKITVAHYIGHIFNDTFLDVYVYLDDPKRVHDYLQTQINKEGLIRGFGYEINKDPTWETVKDFFQSK